MLDVLVIDDEQDIGELIKDIIEDDLKLHTDYVLTSIDALKILKNTYPRIIILDIWLEGSDVDGIALLKILKETYRDIPVIVISGHGNIDMAVRAIKIGAYDFIEKPFKSEKLLLTIKRTLEYADLKKYNYQLKQQTDLSSLIGKSKEMNELKNKISSNTLYNIRIFINGELGVGKEKIARLIHNNSNLSEKPFFKINLENHSEKELHDILFGSSDSSSIFDKAKGATIYLNEISKLTSSLQIKLLQQLNVLQASTNIHQKHRIICSSKMNIKELTACDKFNPDLYQRLCALSFYIPPLRDRKQDIQLTAKHYIEEFSNNYGLSKIKIESAFYLKLLDYSWPGNAIELKNAIEKLIIKLVLSGTKTLKAETLQLDINAYNDSSTEYENTNIHSKNYRDAKKAFERAYIKFQLNRFGKNISQTAKFIGIERPALHKKIKDLNLHCT
jgi:two-component system nitrogen regulation response regulator NtrX